jgi:hypothetical protein
MTINKKITITKTGIKRGDHYYNSCPVAIGLKSAGIERPYVCASEIHGIFEGKEFKINTPKTVTKWIRLYDRKQPVKPITFNLKFSV